MIQVRNNCKKKTIIAVASFTNLGFGEITIIPPGITFPITPPLGMVDQLPPEILTFVDEVEASSGLWINPDSAALIEGGDKRFIAVACYQEKQGVLRKFMKRVTFQI